MVLAEPFQVVKRVVLVFNELNIAYFVGGSLASSLYGIPRTTQDIDIIADIKKCNVSSFVEKLQDKFYVDADMIIDSINREACFNIIFLDTMFKIDIFVLKSNETSQNEMSRKKKYQISKDNSFSIYLASPEDTIINKLYWFKLGNKISTRQWNDILGIIEVRKEILDYSYLEEKAKNLEILDLLKEATS